MSKTTPQAITADFHRWTLRVVPAIVRLRPVAELPTELANVINDPTIDMPRARPAARAAALVRALHETGIATTDLKARFQLGDDPAVVAMDIVKSWDGGR